MGGGAGKLTDGAGKWAKDAEDTGPRPWPGTTPILCLCLSLSWNGRPVSTLEPPLLWVPSCEPTCSLASPSLLSCGCPPDLHRMSHTFLGLLPAGLPAYLPFTVGAVILSALAVLSVSFSAGVCLQTPFLPSLHVASRPLPPTYFVQLDGELLHFSFQPVGIGQLQGVTGGAGTAVPAGNGRSHLPLGSKQPMGMRKEPGSASACA